MELRERKRGRKRMRERVKYIKERKSPVSCLRNRCKRHSHTHTHTHTHTQTHTHTPSCMYSADSYASLMRVLYKEGRTCSAFLHVRNGDVCEVFSTPTRDNGDVCEVF